MLPQWRQRTRRFFHRTPPYPVVYRIASTKAGVDLRFHLLLGPTQWDAVRRYYLDDSNEVFRQPSQVDQRDEAEDEKSENRPPDDATSGRKWSVTMLRDGFSDAWVA